MPGKTKRPYTEAQKRSALKYEHERVDHIRVRVPKGQRETIRAYAATHGESMNGFIVRAINETMERESGKASPIREGEGAPCDEADL